jgi:hypothetical protein
MSIKQRRNDDAKGTSGYTRRKGPSSRTSSTTVLKCRKPGLDSRLRGEKSAPGRQSCGTATANAKAKALFIVSQHNTKFRQNPLRHLRIGHHSVQ